MSRLLEKIIVREGGIYRLITAKENNKDAWYILQIDPASYQEYKRQLRNGILQNIDAYGKLIRSGWGKPPEHILEDF